MIRMPKILPELRLWPTAIATAVVSGQGVGSGAPAWAEDRAGVVAQP